MKETRYQIKIKDIHAAYLDGDISLADAAQQIADRIRKSRPHRNPHHYDQLEYFIERFESLKDQGTILDYYRILFDLNDWCERRPTCWIDIPLPREAASAR